MKKEDAAKPQFVRAVAQREGLENADSPIVFVASTATDKATDGLILDQEGWDLERYRSNPVLMWAHDYSIPPIGRATDIGVEDGALKFTAEFDREDTFAATVERKVRAGFLNAVSVGFSVDWDSIEFVKNEKGGIETAISRKHELLENSVVPIPADPTALAESRARALSKLGHDLIEACEPEQRAGAVLSARNKSDLQQAADLISGVLKSADKEEESSEDDARSADADEVVWEDVANQMVSLMFPETDESDEVRKAKYDGLTRSYKRLGKTAPEYLSVDALAGMTPEEIRGLFLEGEVPAEEPAADLAEEAIAALDALLLLDALS